jgi:hypothetical protein
MKRTLYTGLTFLALLFSGCATTYVNPNLKLTDEKDYHEALEHFTVRKKVYDALYQTLEFAATFLNSSVMKLQIDQNARIYQWNLDQYSAEKSKVDSNLSKHTEIFLSFYTPERKNDDLNKTKTKWKVFLDANGRRYDGKIERIKAEYAEIISLYPHHNRWSTPYRVTFPVPTSAIENGLSKLTLTGPVGSASIEFPALQNSSDLK